MISSDGTWALLGVSEAQLRAGADRLVAHGGLPRSVHQFFDEAGSLLLHSWYRYPFASIAFFHTVLGVEAGLRWAFDANESEGLRDLFQRAVERKIVHDGIFTERTRLRRELKAGLPRIARSYAATLAQLVPLLRNRYFHGNHILAVESLPLCLRLREVADALAQHKERSKPSKPTR